jgi:predicted N-acetyltransferase YhbS
MKFLVNPKSREHQLVSLFSSTFTNSEGSAEGQVIGGLVKDLLSQTALEDIYVIAADKDGILLASCIFTRLTFEHDERHIFLLAPVAVTPEYQGQGLGQKLISHGLKILQMGGIDMAMTYGDPNFYTKLRFHFVEEDNAPAPFPLQQPKGWLGLSLTNEPWSDPRGSSSCVKALNNPIYW